MKRQSMIEHAITQGTLVITERPGRRIMGTVVRDLGDRVVIKVIGAHGLRTGERVTVRATDTTRVTAAVLAEARRELADTPWGDADEADVMAAPAWKIVSVTSRVYGSWAEAASCLV